MNVRISLTLEASEMFLSLYMIVSLERAAVVWAILERISGFDLSLEMIAPRYLKFSTSSSLWPFISSPEPLGSQGELIVYPYSGVRCRRCRRRQQCLNIFSSETALPIKAKFYVEPPWEGGTKVCINGSGHMTKMAAMPIYGKKK